MKNALLIHGSCDKEEYFDNNFPSLSNSHWFPWLQKQLLTSNIFTQTPEMPEPYRPDYIKWKDEFEKFDIDENSMLIGHSCGGGFLVRWLSKNKIKIDKLILVAPWLDPGKIRTDTFFEFTIDPEVVGRTNETHILISTDDEEDVLQSTNKIRNILVNAKVHKFQNKGHFTFSDLKKTEFPELLELII